MSSFGRVFRVQLFGESHGPLVGAVVDGCPAGLKLAPSDLARDLARRRAGGLGTTARREQDLPRIVAGVFEGRTSGAPIVVEIDNREADPSAYREIRHKPRPGHADLAAWLKHGGFNDPRGGGHFSGRLTAPLVAAGAIARKLLSGVSIAARVVEVGGSSRARAALAAAVEAGDTLGGIVECRVDGLPAGLGEPFFDSAEGLLAHAAFAIPGVKGFEVGEGFALGRARGSQCREAILDSTGRVRSNCFGGADGGLTNGNPLVFRVAIKPPVSAGELETVDLRTGRHARLKVGGRHDACIAVRVPVVLEAAAALVLADLMLLQGLLPRVLPSGRRRSSR